MRVPGRLGSFFAVGFVSLLGACGGKGGLLIATITSTSSVTTSTVALDVTASGATRRFDVPVETGTIPPGVEVGIEFPPAKVGTVSLVATVGSLSATGEATLAEGETERITLTLGASNPDLGTDGPNPDLVGADLAGADLAAGDMTVTDDASVVDLTPTDAGEVLDLVVPAPVLHALPTSIGFLKIAMGARSAGVKVKITNDGNASTGALAINLAAPFAKENDLCTGQVLAPAGECTVDLFFSPTAIGSAGTNAIFTDGITTANVALTGEGVQPSQLQATPPSGSATWSNIIVSQSGPKVTFSVKNQGGIATNTLAVTKTSSIPTDKNQFVKGADTCNGQTLAASGGAGDTCSIEVTYTPTTNGSHLAALEVQEQGGGLLVISLSGSALNPPSITVTPVTTGDFGSVPVGKTAKRSFTVANAGDFSADNGNMTYSFTPSAGPYTISGNNCSTGVPAGGSCTLEVTFAPAAVGAAPATSLKARYMGATVPSSEDSEPLTGAGVTAVALAFSGPASFADTQTGSTDQRTYTLTNTGDEVATNIVVSENSTSFSILTNNCDEGVTLAKNQSCIVVIVFTPLAAGTVTGSLTGVATEGSASPFTLTGAGYACTDADADGRFTDARCGGGVDCNDGDTDNWDKCGTCLDSDGDGYFTGCNRYLTHGSECAATANDQTKGPPAEALDAVDDDCDGVTQQVADTDGVFVSATMGLDSNPGTQAAPVASIAKALSLLGGKRAIFMSADTYSVPFTISQAGSNRQIYFYGGFTGASWTRGSARTTFRPNMPAASLFGTAVAAGIIPRQTVLFDRFAFESSGADQLDVHNTQLFLQSCTAAAPPSASAGRGVVLREQSRVVFKDSSFETAEAALDMKAGTRADVTDSFLRTLLAPTVFPNNATAVTIDGGTLNIVSSQVLAGPALGTSAGLGVSGGVVTLSSASSPSQRTLISSDGGGNFGIGVYITGGTVIATGIEIRGGASKDSAAIWQETGGSLRIVSSVLRAAISTDSNPDSIVRVQSDLLQTFVNNFFDATKANQTAGKSVNGITVLSNAAGTVLTNNFLLAVGPSGYSVVAPTSAASGSITLRTNAFMAQTGCAIDSGGCKAINSCASWTRCQTEFNSIFADCDMSSSDHLNDNSPCIGAGSDGVPDNANTPFVDLDGQARPIVAWDIGPDER